MKSPTPTDSHPTNKETNMRQGEAVWVARRSAVLLVYKKKREKL
jgi:hypothetical protein